MNYLKKFKKLFDPIDLTKGPILKTMIPFLIPIVLSLVFQQIYALTDSIIVGKTLNQNEIAAVNDVTSLTSLILNFTIGCTAGFSIIMTKAIGAKDEDTARKSYFTQLILSLIVSVVLTVISLFLIDPLLAWMNIVPSADPNRQEIYEAGKIYVTIVFIFGVLSQMLYNLFSSILRGLGDSFIPFLFLVLSTLINIGLDFLFILGFDMGVAGSAIATVISQALSAVFSFIYIFVKYKHLRFKKEDFKFSKGFIYQHLKLGIPLGFQWSIIYIGVVIMHAAVVPYDLTPEGLAVLNNPAQVGYGVANKFSGFLATFFTAIGNGMISFISQCYGAGDHKRMRDGFKELSILTVILAVVTTIIGLLFTINGAYQKIFLADAVITEDTVKFGNMYIYLALPFFIALGLIYVGRNFLQAIEKPLFPLLSGVLELLCRVVFCMILPEWINGGKIDSTSSITPYQIICSGDPITWVLTGAMLFGVSIYYLKKNFRDSEEKAIASL